MDDYERMSKMIDQLMAIVKEHGCYLITAVQVPNPHRRVVDPVSWDPEVVMIDYMNILTFPPK